MSPLRCLVVDDEPMARALIEQYIGRVPSLTLTSSLGNPLKALELLQHDPPDVLFLDVQMPELTGTSLLKVLRHKPKVVLTTAYSDYALEGYELDVTDYLLKPITFERFLKCVDKLQPGGTAASPNSSAPAAPPSDKVLFVKDGTKSIRVELTDIKYIEGLKDYVRIHLPHRKITTLQSLKNLVEVLPATDFLRTHHSYIVGLKWVDEVSRDDIKIGDEVVPISDSYRKEVRAYVEERYLR